MTISLASEAIIRIKAAHPESPIAVFLHPHPGKLSTVFANTVPTQKLIASNDSNLVGVFHKADIKGGIVDVPAMLHQAARTRPLPGGWVDDSNNRNYKNRSEKLKNG